MGSHHDSGLKGPIEGRVGPRPAPEVVRAWNRFPISNTVGFQVTADLPSALVKLVAQNRAGALASVSPTQLPDPIGDSGRLELPDDPAFGVVFHLLILQVDPCPAIQLAAA